MNQEENLFSQGGKKRLLLRWIRRYRLINQVLFEDQNLHT